jgi:hypothetical protein
MSRSRKTSGQRWPHFEGNGVEADLLSIKAWVQIEDRPLVIRQIVNITPEKGKLVLAFADSTYGVFSPEELFITRCPHVKCLRECVYTPDMPGFPFHIDGTGNRNCWQALRDKGEIN